MDILLISERMNLELENMTLPELKATLAKYNLETTGKRADLVARLTNHFNQKGDEKTKETGKNVKASPKVTSKPSPKLTAKNAPKPTETPTQTSSETLDQTSPKTLKLQSKEVKQTPKSPTVTEELSKPVTDLTMEERLALRAKRFNLEFKTKSENKKRKLVLDEDPELLKRRSERFGIPLVTSKKEKVNTNGAKKKFEFVVDEEELLKRQKRLERFGA